jgi:hypothetical protein
LPLAVQLAGTARPEGVVMTADPSGLKVMLFTTPLVSTCTVCPTISHPGVQFWAPAAAAHARSPTHKAMRAAIIFELPLLEPLPRWFEPALLQLNDSRNKRLQAAAQGRPLDRQIACRVWAVH